ncbi:hypothetical protein BLS_003184 [Venturia inaequalis]|uniref:Uncharacterized protein n=1 Tax=Venturia inaequalis TaxID=5025 RepID=A0A8H3VBE8_VENIN|nr:hypothetical protein BLS_003184 [Venturia inaequalis]
MYGLKQLLVLALAGTALACQCRTDGNTGGTVSLAGTSDIQLRSKSIRNHSMFSCIVQEVYENTAKNDAARQIVVETSITNMERLLDEDDGPFSNMMEAMGEFGKDVSRAVRFSKEIYGKHALRPADYHIDFGYGSVG